jgi:hypothetical protein
MMVNNKRNASHFNQTPQHSKSSRSRLPDNTSFQNTIDRLQQTITALLSPPYVSG